MEIAQNLTLLLVVDVEGEEEVGQVGVVDRVTCVQPATHHFRLSPKHT